MRWGRTQPWAQGGGRCRNPPQAEKSRRPTHRSRIALERASAREGHSQLTPRLPPVLGRPARLYLSPATSLFSQSFRGTPLVWKALGTDTSGATANLQLQTVRGDVLLWP